MDKNMGRIEYIDLAKAFAILLVIIGHAIQYSNGDAFRFSGSYYDNILFRIIYSFHLPLFMFVSGFLGYSSYHKHGPQIWIKRRIITLCPPILFWGGY